MVIAIVVIIVIVLIFIVIAIIVIVIAIIFTVMAIVTGCHDYGSWYSRLYFLIPMSHIVHAWCVRAHTVHSGGGVYRPTPYNARCVEAHSMVVAYESVIRDPSPIGQGLIADRSGAHCR